MQHGSCLFNHRIQAIPHINPSRTRRSVAPSFQAPLPEAHSLVILDNLGHEALDVLDSFVKGLVGQGCLPLLRRLCEILHHSAHQKPLLSAPPFDMNNIRSKIHRYQGFSAVTTRKQGHNGLPGKLPRLTRASRRRRLIAFDR
jgi:hypothetical protein